MTVLYAVALILALVVELVDRGRNLLGWAVVLIALGLSWGWLQGLLHS